MAKKNPHLGSTLESLLREDGTYEDAKNQTIGRPLTLSPVVIFWGLGIGGWGTHPAADAAPLPRGELSHPLLGEVALSLSKGRGGFRLQAAQAANASCPF